MTAHAAGGKAAAQGSGQHDGKRNKKGGVKDPVRAKVRAIACVSMAFTVDMALEQRCKRSAYVMSIAVSCAWRSS